jgi:hypothetical protein
MLSKSSGAPYTSTVLQSTPTQSLLSMVNSFNALLDSGCTHHVVRDRALFRDYVEELISVGTANCGSLNALGCGDVEFRYPFGDRNVIFTLRGCLYAPTAPINLLSVGVLVERGMSCLFLPGGITKVFYPDHHPKLPGLTFSATVTNRLSFLLLDFIPPSSMPSSVPQAVVFTAQVSPPVTVQPVPPLQTVSLPSSSRSSHRKSNSPPKKKPAFANPHYLVIDATLPSHVFNDRSLFTTYVSARKLYRTVHGTDLIVEGIGDVHIRVVVSGKSIVFRFRNSWHVPSSPHHFFSCSTVVLSLGHQVMIAGHSPRMIFSHKKRLIEPNFPKYMPFKRVDHFLVLEFEIPTQVSLSQLPASTMTQPIAQSVPCLSLQASSPCLPFAGLTFNQSLLPTPQSHASVVSNTSAVVASGLHGGADIHVVTVSADDAMNLGVKDQAVASRLTTCGDDRDDVAKTDLFTSRSDVLISSHGEPFAFEDRDTSSLALQVCASSDSSLPQIVPSHHQPPSSSIQSTAYLTPINATQQNSLAVICGIMAAVASGERRYAGVVSTTSVATALPVNGGVDRVDALVEMDVSIVPVNGGVPVDDQATNLCGDHRVKTVETEFFGIFFSSFDFFNLRVDDSFTLRPSVPFSLFPPCISSFSSPSSMNSHTTSLLSSLLTFSCNNSLFHYSTVPSFSTLTLSPSSLCLHFKVSSPPAIIFPSEISSSYSFPLFPLLAMQGCPSSSHPSTSAHPIIFDSTRLGFHFQCYSPLELISSTPSAPSLFGKPGEAHPGSMFYLESAGKPEGGPGFVEFWEFSLVRESWSIPTAQSALREMIDAQAERCPFGSVAVSRRPSLSTRLEQILPISSMERRPPFSTQQNLPISTTARLGVCCTSRFGASHGGPSVVYPMMENLNLRIMMFFDRHQFSETSVLKEEMEECPSLRVTLARIQCRPSSAFRRPSIMCGCIT